MVDGVVTNDNSCKTGQHDAARTAVEISLTRMGEMNLERDSKYARLK